MSFRVIGNSVEDEEMMANAIRSVWGNNSSVISSRDVRRTRVYSDSESEEEEEEGMY